MNRTNWIRQAHRWISILFLAAVGAATYAAVTGQGEESLLYYLPLPPLFLLMASGLFMFVQPYIARWRGNGNASAAE